MLLMQDGKRDRVRIHLRLHSGKPTVPELRQNPTV